MLDRRIGVLSTCHSASMVSAELEEDDQWSVVEKRENKHRTSSSAANEVKVSLLTLMGDGES